MFSFLLTVIMQDVITVKNHTWVDTSDNCVQKHSLLFYSSTPVFHGVQQSFH